VYWFDTVPDFLGFCLTVVFPALEFALVIENIFPVTNKIKISVKDELILTSSLDCQSGFPRLIGGSPFC